MYDIKYFWNKKAIYPLDRFVKDTLVSVLSEFSREDFCGKCQMCPEEANKE